MNVYIKSAVQNVDCEISRLTAIRDQLLNGADTSAAVAPMHPNLPPAVALGAGVQTRGLNQDETKSFELTKKIRALKKQRRKVKMGNGGGAPRVN
jgi:hypothetical protein